MPSTRNVTDKRFDVVVYGATGFTGSLVARYVAAESESAVGNPSAIKWALAARSATKLTQVKEQLKTELPEVDPALIDAIPVVVADSSNEESLVQMVQQTKVVVSLVGPYKLYGELLIKACAENGGALL
uniref:Saccharopine dehydrogenase NADP binding domain-containing protein n=1 Tax=Peronospora matthiolae TaxID=2874970 RepID=A0AAV1TPG0_9STRA